MNENPQIDDTVTEPVYDLGPTPAPVQAQAPAPPPEPEPVKCRICEASIPPYQLKLYNEALCSAHLSIKLMRESAARDGDRSWEERRIRWKELCPEQYRDNDVKRIQLARYEAVTSWKVNPQGLLCMGASQLGKTTSCWKLLESLYINEGIKFEAVTEAEFSNRLSRSFRDSSAGAWLSRLCKVPVLFFDDIGHSASTSKHLEDLFFIVETRTAWKRPIIATTQYTPNELIDASGMGGKKTILAILNRLKRSCKIVQFYEYK
jgi:DNA replication protein DnaC